MTVQIGKTRAEQCLAGRRHEQYAAVAAVPRDHVGHIVRQEPIAVFFGIEQPETGARQRLGAEREPRRIERGRHDAERGKRGVRARIWHRQKMLGVEQHQEAGGAQRQRRRGGDDATRRGQSRFERHDDEPDCGERNDAAGRRGHRRHQSGQRQRRQHVGAFVAAGARQKVSGEDRHHEPGKDHQLDCGRRAAREEVNRERRQRDDAAKEPRRDKGAMPRRRQRILLRRRVNERLDIIPYWREEAHDPVARPLCRRAPLFCCAIVSDAA